jgi:hypothetical protein
MVIDVAIIAAVEATSLRGRESRYATIEIRRRLLAIQSWRQRDNAELHVAISNLDIPPHAKL